ACPAFQDVPLRGGPLAAHLPRRPQVPPAARALVPVRRGRRGRGRPGQGVPDRLRRHQAVGRPDRQTPRPLLPERDRGAGEPDERGDRQVAVGPHPADAAAAGDDRRPRDLLVELRVPRRV
ncbi:MAG: 6-carboxy-5,6,7,8-tetrahydropterin synthase, partial [uncultured Phycisphaerae bacterium]